LAILVQLAVDDPFAMFPFTTNIYCKLAANRDERRASSILCIHRLFPQPEFVAIEKAAARVRITWRTSSTSVAIRPAISDRSSVCQHFLAGLFLAEV